MPATLKPNSREDLVAEVTRLKRDRNAVILSHNYQVPEVQDIADYVGDSLGLSQVAARTEADVIVFCGVHFMAETASIISPEKKVLLPDLGAGCSLAATIDADKLRAWKKEHPNAVVVSYVNTTAEVKAESDYACTSGNAVKVVNSIPRDREILFLPDKTFLPVKDDAVCQYMKTINLEKVYRSLRDMVYEVKVPKETADRARLSIERMLQLA